MIGRRLLLLLLLSRNARGGSAARGAAPAFSGREISRGSGERISATRYFASKGSKKLEASEESAISRSSRKDVDRVEGAKEALGKAGKKARDDVIDGASAKAKREENAGVIEGAVTRPKRGKKAQEKIEQKKDEVIEGALAKPKQEHRKNEEAIEGALAKPMKTKKAKEENETGQRKIEKVVEDSKPKSRPRKVKGEESERKSVTNASKEDSASATRTSVPELVETTGKSVPENDQQESETSVESCKQPQQSSEKKEPEPLLSQVKILAGNDQQDPVHVEETTQQSLEHNSAEAEPEKIVKAAMEDGKQQQANVAVEDCKTEDPAKTKVAEAGGRIDDDFLEVDEELKEFLKDRRIQQEQHSVAVDEDDEDVDEHKWDYRDMRQLPCSTRRLERKLKELSGFALPDDRRVAIVKLKLALELCLSDNLSPQRSVDLANDALKTLGSGADDSIEQGVCLAVLGAGYRGLGQYQKGLSYLQRAARCFDEKNEKGQEVVFEMSFTTNQLALTYFSLGRIKEGVEALIESLDLQESMLPCDDPDLGNDFRKAAEHLCDVQQWEQAKKLCEKAIRVHSKSTGFDNEDVGRDRKVLSQVYKGLNKHEEALEQLRIVRHIFSEDQEAVFLANMAIADSQMSLDSYSEAIATLEKAMESVPKMPVTYHGTGYLKLAKAFYLRNNHKEAQKRLMAALDFYKENLFAECLDEIANHLHEIAAMFDAMGDVKGAVRTLKITIAAYDCVPGGEKMVLNAKMDLGSHLISHGQADKALVQYEEAMATAKKLGFKSNNLLTLTAIAHIELAHYETAVELLEQAKASFQQTTQPELCSVKVPVYRNLVRCFQHLERFEDALSNQKLLVTELRIMGEAESKLPDAIRLLEELAERVNSNKKAQRKEAQAA